MMFGSINQIKKGSCAFIFGFLIVSIYSCESFAALSLSGPVSINNVSTAGPIVVSSMTMSSATIGNLQVLGTVFGGPGVRQIQFSSTTASLAVNTTNFVAVSSFPALSNFKCSMALTDPNDYIRITLSASLHNWNSTATNGLVTILRDGIDLGNPDKSGVTAVTSNFGGSGFEFFTPGPITITDSPNDTQTHTYTVAMRTSGSIEVDFNDADVLAYLVCEEIHL